MLALKGTICIYADWAADVQLQAVIQILSLDTQAGWQSVRLDKPEQPFVYILEQAQGQVHTVKKREGPDREGVKGARVARGGQQAVPDEELLLLPNCDQQIHCCCAGLGRRVLVQGVLQGCQIQSCVLSTCHLVIPHCAVRWVIYTTQSVKQHSRDAHLVLMQCYISCKWYFSDACTTYDW